MAKTSTKKSKDDNAAKAFKERHKERQLEVMKENVKLERISKKTRAQKEVSVAEINRRRRMKDDGVKTRRAKKEAPVDLISADHQANAEGLRQRQSQQVQAATPTRWGNMQLPWSGIPPVYFKYTPTGQRLLDDKACNEPCHRWTPGHLTPYKVGGTWKICGDIDPDDFPGIKDSQIANGCGRFVWEGNAYQEVEMERNHAANVGGARYTDRQWKPMWDQFRKDQLAWTQRRAKRDAGRC